MATIAPAPTGAQMSPSVTHLTAAADPQSHEDTSASTRNAKPVPPSRKGQKLGHAEYLEPEYVTAMVARCSRKSATGLRNRALITFLNLTGARVSEALAVAPADLRLNANPPQVVIRHGKGDRQRTVGLHDEMIYTLEALDRARRKAGVDKGIRVADRRVFATIHGKPLATSYVRALLRRLAGEIAEERGEPPRRVHPHALRCSCATNLVRAGHPLPVVQAVLGHSNVATASIYIQKTFPEQALAAVRGIVEPDRTPRDELADFLSDIGPANAKRLAALMTKIAALARVPRRPGQRRKAPPPPDSLARLAARQGADCRLACGDPLSGRP